MNARFILVAAALAVAPAVAAQTVDEIVARHVTARGGRGALAGVGRVRMTGRATEGPGRQAIVRREIARPGRIRTEFVFQGTTGVWAWDVSTGWSVSPLDGRLEAEPLPADQAAVTAEQADIDGPLVDWKTKGHSVELVGSEALPGGPAHRLKVTLKSGGVREVWVDAATGLVVRTLYEKSILEYQKVIERYPKGNKVPAALLKQGYAFQSLGDKVNSRLIFEELVRKHPSTSEAKAASDKLKELR